MVGVLSPDGEFKEEGIEDVRKYLHAGYMVFGSTSVRFQRAGDKRITPRQLVWLEQHKESLNVHQKIDLRGLMEGW